MESIRHLRHHPKSGVLHYRRIVPRDLRPFIGKGTISATLGSKILDHDALIRWLQIDRDARQRLQDARQKLAEHRHADGRADNQPDILNITTCRSALERWQREELGRLSAKLYGIFEGDDVAGGLVAFSAEMSDLAHENEHRPADGFDPMIRGALGTVGLSVPDAHAALPALRWMMRNLAREMYEMIGQAVTTCSAGRLPSAEAAPPVPARGSDAPEADREVAPIKDTSASPIRLSALADAYLRHCDATDDYATDLRMYVRRLTESLGEDRPAERISKWAIVHFLEQISEIPARLTARERKMPLPELVHETKAGDAGDPARPRLHSRTIEKWLVCLGAMFRYGGTHDLCSINPVEGISVPRKKTLEPPRQHFEPAELTMIFTSPLYRGHASDAYRCKPGPHIIRDEKYWMPLLALFTGYRRDEMAQARTADIKEDDLPRPIARHARRRGRLRAWCRCRPGLSLRDTDERQ